MNDLCFASVTESGGRFVSPSMAKKYGFEVPEYQGVDQVVEVATNGEKL